MSKAERFWIASEERMLSVISEVEDLKSRNMHTDCVLVGGGARFRCHAVWLASVSKVFRDILPQPGEEREDTVIILPEWGEDELESAITMIYSGAVIYKIGREKFGRFAALMESIGVGLEGFRDPIVELEDSRGMKHEENMDVDYGVNSQELKILDVKTVSAEVHNGNQIKSFSVKDNPADNITSEHSIKVTCASSIIAQPSKDSLKMSNQIVQFNPKIHCFRCSGVQGTHSDYHAHLLQHIMDTKTCIGKLQKHVLAGERVDWECESCYIDLLSEHHKKNLGQEAFDVLSKHKLVCMNEINMEIDTVNERMKSDLIVEDSPVCDKCGKLFKLRIQLIKHKKTCSMPTLPLETPRSLLSLLNASNWTECPCCLDKRDCRENMVHHLVTHQEIRTLMENDTPYQDEYRCSIHIFVLTAELRSSYLRHKYQNCEQGKSNFEDLLDRFTLGDMKFMEASSMNDTENNEGDDGIEEFENDTSSDISYEVNTKNLPGNVWSSSNVNVSGDIKSKERRQHRSGRSGDENLRTNRELCGNEGSRKCPQCLGVFQQLRDFKSNIKHFCERVGMLSEPLKELTNPTPSKLVTNKCNICVGGPVLVSEDHLKKHLVLAHKGSFFVQELKTKKFNDNNFPTPCYLCEKELVGWEDAILHVGIYHEKLFQALKHDKINDYTRLLKRLFPDKYNKWNKHLNAKKERSKTSCDTQNNTSVDTSVDTGIASMVSRVQNSFPKTTVKRKLLTEDQTKNPEPDENQKKVLRLENVNESGRNRQPGPAKERLLCSICPCEITATYSGLTYLHQHMAFAHFSDYILTHYPHPKLSTSTSHYPCLFPNCTTVLSSLPGRVKHLGAVHRQVNTCLATPKLVEQAKEAAKLDTVPTKKRRGSGSSSRSRRSSIEVDCLTCAKCHSQFATRESLKLHTCYSLLDRAEQVCGQGGNTQDRSARPSSLKEADNPDEEADNPDESPVKKVIQSAVGTTSKSGTPNSLALILSDSEEDDFSSNFAKTRKKVEELCTSDTDSDDMEIRDEESDMFDTHEHSYTPTPPGMVLEEAVTDVHQKNSCKACNRTFESASALEMHRKCEKCSSQYRVLVHTTCEIHTICEYCCKCYNKGEDVHVTCDGAKCKQCFSSEKEKNKHFHENHGWDDL